jgi:hypothetical protein
MIKSKDSFVAWENGDAQGFQKASASYSKAQNEIRPINRSTASIANRFRNIDSPNTSVRDSYSRLDYEYFRPNEAMPKRHKDIIGACMEAYKRVAVVRQVVDMMGDFCAQGIRLVHPNKSIEKFYQAWADKVHFVERSERFANLFYRTGNVIVKRATAKIDENTALEWKRSIAKTDLDIPDEYKTGPMEIPIKYSFLNPLSIDVVGEELAAFTGEVKYVLRMPNRVSSVLNSGLFGLDPSMLLENVPDDIKNAINTNQKYLLLKNEKLLSYYYKKDDWEVWAYPMLYSLLDDLIYLEKMKLADLTALDGIISHIRIWKLGSLEHRIFPTDAAIAKLSNILLNHVAGGAMDFIWGPDLTIEETSTDLHRFLGSEKYQAVITSIHSGLGIPASISGAGGTFANNFMSLRTLLERLEYGRRMLRDFWTNEIKLIQKAMGFRYPAQISFDHMNFQDETAEKALWIQLSDRNLVSDETIQELFGAIPEIESIRLRRENKAREDKQSTPKVSPYHDAEPELSLKKIALQRGLVTPGEAGIELDEREPGEKNMLEVQQEQFKMQQQQKLANKPKPIGRSGQGRPKNSKDSSTRKRRVVNPSSKAEVDEFVNLTLYANQVQKIIHDQFTPFFLQKFGKTNLRQLTQAEEKEMDDFKHCLLYQIPYEEAATEELIMSSINNINMQYDNNAFALYKQLVADFGRVKSREPNYEDIKQLRNAVYASIKINFNNPDEGDEE